MKCPNCGEELLDGVLFCRECGHKIRREPQKRFCRECGAELEPNAKFCSTCGAKVLTEEDIVREGIVDVPPYDDDEDEQGVQVVNIPHDAKPAKLGIKETIHNWWDRLDWITKACTIASLFFLFALMIAWIAHKPLALIASVIQIVLVGVTCGIHLNTIKTDKRWLSWVLPVIVLLMASAYVEDFKPKNNAIPDSNITVETTVWETTTPETTEIVETTEYVLADDEVRIDFSKYDLMVENYEDITYRLSNLGFTNISYRIQYDIVWGITKEGEVASVSIAGRTDYKKGDIFKADDPVVIAYHMKTEDDPNKIDESSKNEGNSGSTTSTTAETASNENSDVKAPVMKGSSVDKITEVAKQHGLTIAFDDLDFGHGTKQRSMADNTDVAKMGLSLDICYDVETKEILFVEIVSFDGFSTREKQKEFIAAVSGVSCPLDDAKAVSDWVNSNLGREAKTAINGRTYELSFGISGNLVFDAGEPEWEAWELSFDAQDAEQTETPKSTNSSSYDYWADYLFSVWDGGCPKLEKMIKKNMNDPDSFKERETTRYYATNENTKKALNDVLAEYGFSEKLDINDVVVACEFTGKNKLGGTVRNTAVAIIRYSSQTIELLGFV